MDQGGELTWSANFCTTILKEFDYVIKPTGADSPSQNGGAEMYNNTLGVKVRTLLCGSGLLAKFWSTALLHAVYLHNRLVHSATGKTPFEGWHNRKPDNMFLKIFGSRVCVKRTGTQRCKLDHHNFTGIFLGYTATDQNIVYLDTTSSIVKSCHHAVFDEAWYLQPSCPPAAQLLYNLGLEAENKFVSIDGPLHPPIKGSGTPITVPWPPVAQTPLKKTWQAPPLSLITLLPLRLTEAPPSITARAARTRVNDTPLTNNDLTSQTVTEYLIGPRDMELIYLSPDPYGHTFEEQLDLRQWDLDKHRSTGLRFIIKNNRMILASMDKSTPGACIAKWRTLICGAWLQSINGTTVSSLADIHQVFQSLSNNNAALCTLTFSHPDISPDI
jgi:hypothetical protein